MRENIGLFRGKRIDNGEWAQGFLFAEGSRVEIVRGTCNNTGLEGVDVYPDTVGECTGLRDTNGKLIFEGDITRTERDLWHGESKKEREIFNSVVWYDSKHTCFGLKSDKYRCLPIHRFKGDFTEIIGTIHDNPELLKN